MTKQLDEKAEAAWEAYKHSMRHHPRRQLRRRDFIAGYVQGTQDEHVRTMVTVLPVNLALERLSVAIDQDPTLVDRMWTLYPKTMRSLMKFLRGEYVTS